MEKVTSLDVNNLTYLAGCLCCSVFCELKEDSQFSVLWLYKTKIVLFLSCFIVINQVLCYVIVSASHSCTTNGNPLSASERKTKVLW